jgi:metallo-beta-lactamase class B
MATALSLNELVAQPLGISAGKRWELGLRSNMLKPLNIASLVASSLLALAFSAHAQGVSDWLEPFPPHQVAGNLYYVGSKGLASYLVTTPEGHILINSSLEESPKLIQASVEKLGFNFQDIKILLISHAHSDHCAGSAEIVRATGAKYLVMEGDAAVVETGGGSRSRLNKADYTQFPPAKVDRVLKDGDEVKLGGAVLTAHLTPGHTKGCTTWTMRVKDRDKTLNAVIIGSPNVNPGYLLVNNRNYPAIAQDYEKCFRVLKALPVDLFLGAHGSYYDMANKAARLTPGGANPFIDPQGYAAYVADREKAFQNELGKQQEDAKP